MKTARRVREAERCGGWREERTKTREKKEKKCQDKQGENQGSSKVFFFLLSLQGNSVFKKLQRLGRRQYSKAILAVKHS